MPRRAWLLTAILAAVWGASYMFIKVALDGGLSEAFIVFARTLLAAAVLIPWALRSNALAPLRGRFGAIAVLAAIQVVGPFLLITFGENNISSSMAGILVSSAPLFTALLAIRFDQAERSHGWGLVGVVVGILGVALLFGLDLSTDSAALLGGLMVLLASFGYAVGALLLKHRLRGVPPVGIASGTMSMSALMTLPLVFAMPPEHASASAIGAILALGAGGTGLAFGIFYTLIADIGPARASIVAYIAPGFAVGYGVALLGESFTVGAALGLVLILAGSWLAAERRAPRWLPGVSRSASSRSTAPVPARAR